MSIRPIITVGEPVLWCEFAWLGSPEPDAGVLIELAGDQIRSVREGALTPPAGATALPGLTLPGLANGHSHSFQRALRGRTQRQAGGSFWTWREQMYALAQRLDEQRLEALARATFAEMALAGFTLVGEFDYLHFSEAIGRAAADAGIRLTLIDACYLDGGLPRFRDASVTAWCERVAGFPASDLVRPAAAIHSLRALNPQDAAAVAEFAADRSWPLHAHVSEQVAENDECLARYGHTPVELLARAGALSPRFTAVHGTHLSDRDRELLLEAGAFCCMCPTTERDLADGIGPVAGRLTVGSDSQSVIDPFEEARAVEMDTRLASGVRGSFAAVELAAGLTLWGYQSLGWREGGAIEAGALADLTTVSLDGVRLAGTPAEHALDAVIFAAGAGDVSDVMVGGRFVVRDGAHLTIDVAGELRAAISGAWE
jgi:formiminoglutamate deiminase